MLGAERWIGFIHLFIVPHPPRAGKGSVVITLHVLRPDAEREDYSRSAGNQESGVRISSRVHRVDPSWSIRKTLSSSFSPPSLVLARNFRRAILTGERAA